MSEANLTQSGSNNRQAGGDMLNVDKLVLQLPTLEKNPSVIARVISELAHKTSIDVPVEYSAVSFYDIKEKIEYNKVIRYRPLIDKYGYFGGIVESICENLDVDKPNTKSRIFEYITYLYLQEKATICGTAPEEECLQLIQENADTIIANVHKGLSDLMEKSSGLEGVDIEDVQISLITLIAVAFINCKILEKPPTNI